MLLLGFLIVGWAFAQFADLHQTVIVGMNELFSIEMTEAGYYTLFFIAGLIAELSDTIVKSIKKARDNE